ncbi:MAG: hypothetical protein FWF91_00330 [Coriobacteriia bacterium]|nr:hypothetical protein [Coriobacteriia bacterium]
MRTIVTKGMTKGTVPFVILRLSPRTCMTKGTVPFVMPLDAHGKCALGVEMPRG